MKNRAYGFYLLSCLFVSTLIVLCGTGVFAQPSEARVKKALTSPKTVSIKLGDPGTREWSSTYKKYIWTRHFESRLKSDYPDIFVIVKGYIAYDIIGGKFIYWRTFTTSNNYEGIPDPSEADVRALIDKFGARMFMGAYYFDHVVGKVESIRLAKDPKFEWHKPNSVSFNIVTVYTERANNVGGKERLARTFRIRLYRDTVKSDWKNLMSTPESVEKL